MSSFNPVIIIGAARSGTNMLRDLLTQLPEFGTWNCDEINAIWHYGNTSLDTDELDISLLNTNIKKYIRNSFQKQWNKLGTKHIVEKTCANSLRVEFVDNIFPEAKYIFIYRDGRDAISSAIKRWYSKFDLAYTFKKARFVPIRSIPHYASSFLKNRIIQLFSGDGQLESWGPKYKGIDNDLKRFPLHVVAAIQWQKSVEMAYEYLHNLHSSKVYFIKYEDFVTNPEENFESLLAFLEVKKSFSISDLVSNVKSSNIGKWKSDLSNQQIEDIDKVIRKTLKKFEYV